MNSVQSVVTGPAPLVEKFNRSSIRFVVRPGQQAEIPTEGVVEKTNSIWLDWSQNLRRLVDEKYWDYKGQNILEVVLQQLEARPNLIYAIQIQGTAPSECQKLTLVALPRDANPVAKYVWAWLGFALGNATPHPGPFSLSYKGPSRKDTYKDAQRTRHHSNKSNRIDAQFEQLQKMLQQTVSEHKSIKSAKILHFRPQQPSQQPLRPFEFEETKTRVSFSPKSVKSTQNLPVVDKVIKITVQDSDEKIRVRSPEGLEMLCEQLSKILDMPGKYIIRDFKLQYLNPYDEWSGMWDNDDFLHALHESGQEAEFRLVRKGT